MCFFFFFFFAPPSSSFLLLSSFCWPTPTGNIGAMGTPHTTDPIAEAGRSRMGLGEEGGGGWEVSGSGVGGGGWSGEEEAEHVKSA